MDSNHIQQSEMLINRIYEEVGKIEYSKVGIAFSGGVDSSLLAKVCKNIGKKVILLTISNSNSEDYEISKEISSKLSVKNIYNRIPLSTFEGDLRKVISMINFDRLVLLEISLGFYYVFKLAVKKKIKTVLSASGIDELFCGYDAFRNKYSNKTELMKLMNDYIQQAKLDKKEIDKIANSFGIRYICPFMSNGFIDYAKSIPINLKIKSPNDKIRKHILRDTALRIGVPIKSAYRSKKAFQYSSGIHKLIVKILREKGFVQGKIKGNQSKNGMSEYLRNLQKS